MYSIIRTDEEINDLLDKCSEAENEGTTKYRGETYEMGIKTAIDWLTQEGFEHPLDD